MGTAFLIAHNTSERIDDIMWKMPVAQAFKLMALIYSANTGEEVKTHEEKAVLKKQHEKLTELASG